MKLTEAQKSGIREAVKRWVFFHRQTAFSQERNDFQWWYWEPGMSERIEVTRVNADRERDGFEGLVELIQRELDVEGREGNAEEKAYQRLAGQPVIAASVGISWK
jgi:hypothetical protein